MHRITFTSSRFDVAAETPNPINPIAGVGILTWLREKLRAAGHEVSAPWPEDWGWCIHVKDRDSAYLVGASSDVDPSDPRQWTIVIHRERSLKDKLLGRNRLADDDPVSARIECVVRQNIEARDVRVDKSA